jgi:hypothetical protein
MIRTFSLFAALLLAGLATGHGQMVIRNDQAQSQLEVIANNGADKPTRLQSVDGLVPLVLVRPNQTVPITLQFPIEKAGTPIAATPLDGGTVKGGTPMVLPTGKVVLTFRPGPTPGRYRLLVRTPLEQHLLEFYVVDATHHPRFQPPGNG